MRVSKAVQDRVIATVKKNIADASAYYSRTFKMPTILFTQRGATAGRATMQLNTVNYNPILLMENQDDFMGRTVPHEVAHLIDFRVNPHNFTRSYGGKRSVHGPDFKFIMTQVLGCKDGARCHSYDVSNASTKKKKHEWVCDDCGAKMLLGPKRQKNMLRDSGRYRPRGCSFTHSYVHGYTGIEGSNPVLRHAANSPKTTSTTTHKKSTGQSNKAIAQKVWHTTFSRSQFINGCVSAGMKKTTSATYYQNFKSGMWS